MLEKENKKHSIFLPIFLKIDQLLVRDSIIIAIDGGSGSGKTTLSRTLQEMYDCTVFHMDDFFLRPEQRTPERYAEVGGNIDRERFIQEVLEPLRRKETVLFRRFDCKTMKLEPEIEILPKRMTVIEGVYSMHTDFEQYYTTSVFLDIASDLQRSRIRGRNSKKMVQRFENEWIPMERTYFERMQVKERCAMVINVNGV